MTDYSTWVLKDKHEKLLFGPYQGEAEYWAWLVEYVDGSLGAYTSVSRSITDHFEPPEPEWTYYRKSLPRGNHRIYIPTTEPGVATHRSKDGGDTIERIK